MRNFWLGILACAAMSWASASHAQSLAVEPLFIEVAPGQSAAIRVRNSSTTKQTVEVSVVERVVGEDGQASRVPADDVFVLFPPQGVIEPNSVQVFRVQPINPQNDKSRSYYVTVRQLPVDLVNTGAEGAQLQVVFAFDVAIHVVPRGAKSLPVIEAAKPTTATVSTVEIDDPNRSPDPSARAREPKETVPGVEITLRNDGTKYLYLQELSYVIEGVNAAGAKVELPILDEAAVLDAVQMPLVLPGTTRRFVLPFKGTQTLTSVTARARPRAGGN